MPSSLAGWPSTRPALVATRLSVSAARWTSAARQGRGSSPGGRATGGEAGECVATPFSVPVSAASRHHLAQIWRRRGPRRSSALQVRPQRRRGSPAPSRLPCSPLTASGKPGRPVLGSRDGTVGPGPGRRWGLRKAVLTGFNALMMTTKRSLNGIRARSRVLLTRFDTKSSMFYAADCGAPQWKMEGRRRDASCSR